MSYEYDFKCPGGVQYAIEHWNLAIKHAVYSFHFYDKPTYVWTPAEGDFYCLTRGDLSLYMIGEATETEIKMHCIVDGEGKPVEGSSSVWLRKDFVDAKGFFVNRMPIPHFLWNK